MFDHFRTKWSRQNDLHETVGNDNLLGALWVLRTGDLCLNPSHWQNNFCPKQFFTLQRKNWIWELTLFFEQNYEQKYFFLHLRCYNNKVPCAHWWNLLESRLHHWPESNFVLIKILYACVKYLSDSKANSFRKNKYLSKASDYFGIPLTWIITHLTQLMANQLIEENYHVRYLTMDVNSDL